MMKFWDLPKILKKINDELGDLIERVRNLEETGQQRLERLARLEADMGWVKWMTLAILGGIIALLIKVYIAP